MIVTYEGQDLEHLHNKEQYTRVLIKGTCGERKWIRKSLLPVDTVIDQQYEIVLNKYQIL